MSTHNHQQKEHANYGAGSPSLKGGAGANSAKIQPGQRNRARRAEHQARQSRQARIAQDDRQVRLLRYLPRPLSDWMAYRHLLRTLKK